MSFFPFNVAHERRQRAIRRFVWALLCLLSPIATGEAAPEASSPDRPNIVLILADDLGLGDLGCYNADSKIPTPHLDRMAAAGMKFTDAHSPSSVCTPTRYGLLTGRYAWRTRLKSGVLWGFSRALIEPDRRTIASMLHDAGYRTGGVGKWHLGFQAYDPSRKESDQPVEYDKPLLPGPLSVGFDSYFGIPASLDMEPYVWVNNDGLVEQPTESDPGSKRVWDGGGGFWRAGPTAPNFKHSGVLPTIGDKSVEFIKTGQQDKSARPFFLYVPLASPHTPWVPTDEYRGRTQAGTYGDFTHQTDAVVGQILQELERSGQTENTLVIVTSDNGSHWPQKMIGQFDHVANGHVRGMKADIWEGGHRVPFLVRWPDHVPAGTTSDAVVCLTDVYATVAEILGDLPNDHTAEDSFSMLGLLRDPSITASDRKSIVHHSVDGTFAIRSGRWKLVEGNLGSGGFTPPRRVPPTADGPKGQLYDLDADPLEAENAYDEHPEVVEQLTALLHQTRQAGRSRPAAQP